MLLRKIEWNAGEEADWRLRMSEAVEREYDHSLFDPPSLTLRGITELLRTDRHARAVAEFRQGLEGADHDARFELHQDVEVLCEAP